MLSAFKQMVARDNEKVFMDKNVFADEHRVDGEVISCIVQDATLNEGSEDFPVTRNVKILHAQTRDLPEERGYGETLMVDGIPYMVISWTRNMGMAVVTLDINAGV